MVDDICRCDAQSHRMPVRMPLFLKALPRREPFLLCLAFQKQKVS